MKHMKHMKKKLLIASILVASGVGVGFADPAAAASLVTISVNQDDVPDPDQGNPNNVCAGAFGQPFDSCDVGFPLGLEISPVILKFESGKVEVAEQYQEDNGKGISDDGSEFTFSSEDLFDSKSGSWEYDPGEGDPLVKYWAAKGGQGFELYWTVHEEDTQSEGVCFGDNLFTQECLEAAIAVTEGEWEIDTGDLSNLTFFNSAQEHDDDGQDIPEPAAMAGLMAVGAGLVINRRKKTQ